MTTAYDWTGKQTWIVEERRHVTQIRRSLDEIKEDNPRWWNEPYFAWEEIIDPDYGMPMSRLMFECQDKQAPSRWLDTGVRVYRHS